MQSIFCGERSTRKKKERVYGLVARPNKKPLLNYKPDLLGHCPGFKNDCSLLYVPVQNAYIKKGLNEFKELLYLVAKYKLLNNE